MSVYMLCVCACLYLSASLDTLRTQNSYLLFQWKTNTQSLVQLKTNTIRTSSLEYSRQYYATVHLPIWSYHTSNSHSITNSALYLSAQRSTWRILYPTLTLWTEYQHWTRSHLLPAMISHTQVRVYLWKSTRRTSTAIKDFPIKIHVFPWHAQGFLPWRLSISKNQGQSGRSLFVR